MYDLDDDFTSNYDPKKAAEKALTPFFPRAKFNGQILLKSVKKDKSPTKGKYFQFKVQVTKSDTELVPVGGTYVLRFNQGASDVSNEICWRNMLPILMAANGVSDILSFNAPQALGELLNLSKEVGDGLDLPMGMQRVLELARPDKTTGKLDPKHLNPDGSVKEYPRDTFTVVATPAAASAPAA